MQNTKTNKDNNRDCSNMCYHSVSFSLALHSVNPNGQESTRLSPNYLLVTDDARLPTTTHLLRLFFIFSPFSFSSFLFLCFIRSSYRSVSGKIRTLGEPSRRDLIAGAVMCCAVWRANISGRDVIAGITSYR